jgi:acetolactate synthase-1/2/3 large subunit
MQTLQKTKATSKQEKVSQSSINGAEAVNISGSEAVMRALVAEKVDTIFGYPGGAIMPIYDALYDYADTLKHILVRH